MTVSEIVAQFKQNLRPWLEIAGLKRPRDTDAVDRLLGLLAKLPPADAMGNELAELVQNAQHTCSTLVQERAESFGRNLAAFVRDQRTAGTVVKETAGGAWRVGALLMETKPSAGAVRLAYNQSPLDKAWTVVSTPEAIMKCYQSGCAALAQLDALQLPLARVTWEAFQHLKATGQAGPDGKRAPVRAFATELRIAIVRELVTRNKKKDAGQLACGAEWQTFYLIDRYRDLLRTRQQAPRVVFETGSMQETSKMGVMLDGLSPESEYRVYCYVVPVETA